MRKNVILGLITTAVLVFGASSASALALDANIAGIFTDSSFAVPVAGATIDANGDAAQFTGLAAGQGILITIDVDNAPGDFITGIFATLTVDSSQVAFLGGAPNPSILAGGPVFMPTNLTNIGSAAIKGNSPHLTAGTEMWIQALAYGAAAGTSGAGPDIAAVQLFFVVTGASGADQIDLLFGLTAGDAIDAPNTTFSSAVINVPEPGTALLMGLGLAGLAGAGRRKNS